MDNELLKPLTLKGVTPKNTEKLDAFMDELYANTAMNINYPRECIWQGVVGIECEPRWGNIHITSIRTFPSDPALNQKSTRGQGHASRALDWLCSLADKHQVTLDGICKPFSGDFEEDRKTRFNKSQLLAWYKRHGFTAEPNGKVVREPKGAEPEKKEPVRLKLGPTMRTIPMDKQSSAPEIKQYKNGRLTYKRDGVVVEVTNCEKPGWPSLKVQVYDDKNRYTYWRYVNVHSTESMEYMNARYKELGVNGQDPEHAIIVPHDELEAMRDKPVPNNLRLQAAEMEFNDYQKIRGTRTSWSQDDAWLKKWKAKQGSGTRTAYHITLTKDVPQIMQEGLKPQVGPRAQALGEPENGIYLFPTMEDCETALGSWLGDEFEDEDLTLLEVKVPANARLLPTTAEYEIVVADPIPAENIRVTDIEV